MSLVPFFSSGRRRRTEKIKMKTSWEEIWGRRKRGTCYQQGELQKVVHLNFRSLDFQYLIVLISKNSSILRSKPRTRGNK